MKKIMFITTALLCIMVFMTMAFADQLGFRKRRPAYHEYANVVINNFSAKNKIAPVVYNHWLHRSKYTCRVCHLDLKFAMKGGGTGITEESNNKGLYCGACHNGKEAFGPEEKAESGEKARKNCDRCHSYGENVDFKYRFYRYTKDYPRARFGNGIDWLEAEKSNLIQLKDHLEGISSKRETIKKPGEETFKPKEPEMPDIIFSHDKHAVWSGCDQCHPAIFSEKKGENKFTMEEIFAGKYCGTCHGKVSFSTLDCQKCHVKRML